MNRNLNDWLVGTASVAVLFAVYSFVNYLERDDRQVMCQITQGADKKVHLMPCRLVASYLAEVTL